jgi:hypothetical protein
VTRWSSDRRAGAGATSRGGRRGGGVPSRVRCTGQRPRGGAVDTWMAEGNDRDMWGQRNNPEWESHRTDHYGCLGRPSPSHARRHLDGRDGGRPNPTWVVQTKRERVPSSHDISSSMSQFLKT